MEDKLLKYLDEFSLAGKGLLLATKKKSFWIPFVVTFVIFGTLINLLSSGFSSFNLMASSGFLGAIKILGNAFLGIFGIHKNFEDWILNFLLTILQSILISLVVIVFNHNKKTRKSSGSSGLESSAIVAGLAVLGSGCPTCGTTLLAPLLGTILSGSASAVGLAGKLSFIANILATLLAIFVFKKLGFETYAIIKSEERMKKELNKK